MANHYVELEARPTPWKIGGGHQPLDGWAYNGTVPGPIIDARQGDTLVVRLANNLDEPTTIHWHGLRLPAPLDGTEHVQKSVPPGGTFEYRFALPDAGTFWYYPHTNETVQLERGLYGVLVVRGDHDPQVDRDRVLVFDDVKLDRRRSIAKARGVTERHNGREGNVTLLNGRVEPAFEMAAGQIERWRLVNVASARYIRFSLGDIPFRIIGTDGGLIETPVTVSDVSLAPADRVDIIVGPFDEGRRLDILSLRPPTAVRRRKPNRFGKVRVGAWQPSVADIPETLRAIEPLAAIDAAPTREVRLSGWPSASRGFDFMVNGERHHHADSVRVGDLQVWDLVNLTPMDHPFHLHGFFFQVLSVNGAAPEYRSWEDTVHVPPMGRVKIAWLPDDRPGPWMAHCHILEHHAAGMMMHFNVIKEQE